MIIAPSVLSLDYGKFNESIDILNKNTKWLHFDVMDGHFVDNLSFGPDILKSFRRNSELFMDVHLMVSDPFKFVDTFVKAGADNITFHIEALNGDIDLASKLIQNIKSKYIRTGVSIKPRTSIKSIEAILQDVDIVLLMSVEPGFGGQELITTVYEKIKFLKKYREINDLHFLIEVDGGVNDINAKELSEAGADILVAGSYIFKDDIRLAIDKLKYISNSK